MRLWSKPNNSRHEGRQFDGQPASRRARPVRGCYLAGARGPGTHAVQTGGTRQNRQNLVLAIWSVTWGAAGLGDEPTRRPPGVLSVLSVTRAPHPVAHSGAAKRSRTGHVVRRTAPNVLSTPNKPGRAPS